MKLSEVTISTVKEYLRVTSDDEDNTIELIISGATAYIKGYTGLDKITIDTHEDITIAFLSLCSDMFDVRQVTVQNDKVNPVVSTILSMYATNYL